jgi:pyridoxal/pyridoxine/pyridoxamine kinase
MEKDKSCVETITGYAIDEIIKGFKNKKNKSKIIKYIIDPILSDLTIRYYPHFLTIIIILVLMVILLITLLLIILFDK